MKYVNTFLLGILITASASAQIHYDPHTNFNTAELRSQGSKSLLHKALWPQLFLADKQQQFSLKSPLLMAQTNSNSFKGGNYWMGSMTSQSYHKGKFGTYYLWDMQGNLRESRTFFDIAGKNKRGLKLVFRRR